MTTSSNFAAAINAALGHGRRNWTAMYARQSATIHRAVTTEGADWAETFTALPDTVPCRVIRDNKGAEVVEGEQIISVRAVEIRFPFGTEILTTDRIGIEELTYSVLSTDQTRADMLYLSVTATLVP